MSRFLPLKVKEVRRETEDCVSVAFDVPEKQVDDFQFIQGQYITLKAAIDGEEVRRSYSICVSPYDEELRVAIKKVPGGKFSTYANEVLQAGAELEVMPPMGNFYTLLDPQATKHYLGFAAGSGITPLMSIVKTVLATEPRSRFTLFYGNRTVDSIIFREALEALKNEYMDRFTIHYLLSREHPGADLFFGRIDAEKCAVFFDRLVDIQDVDEAFLCGPEAMIHEVSGALQERGLDKKHIHFELFYSAAAEQARQTRAPRPPMQKGGTLVHITIDGNQQEFRIEDSNQSILDEAIAAGADLPYSCKGGVCSTCRARLLEGEVDMPINYALEEDELAAGFILTCQAYPKSQAVKIDFDV
jgi:ring-1,2-phenylacetyl-CoA epoxidase subunit PaaE